MRTAPTSSPDVAGAAMALADHLDELRRQYVQLDSMLEGREAAIRDSRLPDLHDALLRENALFQRIAHSERRRLELVERITDVIGAPPERRRVVTWIAGALGGEAGARLADAAEDLRAVMQRYLDRQGASRLAVEQLAAHSEGLLRAVASKLSHTGAYSQRGLVEAGPAVVSAVDLTT